MTDGTSTNSVASPNAPTRRNKKLLLVVRRAHLFLGLLLAPWAMLYGVTGFLFNHPTYFSERDLRHIQAKVLAECGFDGSLANPADAAQEVIEVLKQRYPAANISLLTTVPPKYVGEFFFATSDADLVTHQVLIRRDGGGGTYVSTRKPLPPDNAIASFDSAAASVGSVNPPSMKTAPAPKPALNEEASSEVNRVTIPSGAAAEVEASLLQLGDRLAIEGMIQPFKLTSAPILQFAVKGDSSEWQVKYDSFRGTVTTAKLESMVTKEERGWRSFWTKLHTANGYPGVLEARWYWAFMVDATAMVMVFWSISGFLMWWQLKQLRLVGGVAVVISIAAATVLFSGMSQHL